MTVLDHVQLHNLCAHCVNTPLDASAVFGEPDSEGFRTSAWGRLHDRNYAAFLVQVQLTAHVVSLKAGFVAAWKAAI